MKNKIICMLFTLIAICVVYIDMSNILNEYNNVIKIDSVVKYVDSDILEKEKVDEDIPSVIETIQDVIVEEEKVISEVVVPEVKEPVQEKFEEKEVIVEPSATVENTNEVIAGNMSGYGPDCKGCSGYVSYGMYVGEGNIYYNDKEFGQVRIVAGDKKYKFGTIVKINDSMLAIVLDRGGAIGIGKRFLFDLLYESEAEASKYGVSYNTKFEILRNGF